MISDGIENCLTYVANFDPENQITLLHILHKLYTTHLYEEYKKKRNKQQLNKNLYLNLV